MPQDTPAFAAAHSHVFLGQGHEQAERRTWAVIALCGAMMLLEIVGGWLFGSIALIADGLHMSTHAGAMLLAALAYSYARRHAGDPRFTFGTGKLGDLAGFSSAIILALIALLIGYEAIRRFLDPVPIQFDQAIPIACLGLAVNAASAWLLSGGHHHHGHAHHHHADPHGDAAAHRVVVFDDILRLSIFEHDHPPVFRLDVEAGGVAGEMELETVRPDGTRQTFTLRARQGFLQSDQVIPEPHEFDVRLRTGGRDHWLHFAEHDHADHHGATHRDNNMRAAIIHVIADAAVSLLVIAGLVMARAFAWPWMDPLAGIIGAGVIASWSYGLIRDTGAILLDMNPDQRVTEGIRNTLEATGDRLADLHVWRLAPGHLGAIVSIETRQARAPEFYRAQLAGFRSLSHITVEVQNAR